MRTIQRDIVGGFIISKDGKILLGNNRPGGVYEGHFVVPGGGVDEGETKLEALTREMLEETGIDISRATVTELYTSQGEHEKTLRDSGERVFVQMNFFDYRIDLETSAVDTKVMAEDDWTNPTWFDLTELETANLGHPTRRTLDKAGIIRS